MLLRAAIVMLFMLNLGAAGWWLFQPDARAATPVAAEAPGLRLLAEQTMPTPAMAVSPAPAEATPVTAPATASAPVATPAAPTCLRFGPFTDAAARAAAQAALAAAGVPATPRDVAARGVRAWKVFLPAQASREAAQALADKLKAGGVNDLFVMTQGAEANSIALGRFSSEAGARQRQAQLQGKGVQAQVGPVGGEPAQVWLEARLPAGVDRAALAKLAPALTLDCARLR